MDAEPELSKAGGAPSRRRDKAKTVAVLKSAAREQLISRGLARLSIQPILDKADVSRGALFHHFRSKNHLIAAAFKDLLEEAARQLHALSEDLRAGRIALGAFVEGVRDVFCSDLFIGSMEIALSNRAEPILRDLVSEAVDDWWAALSSFWTGTFDLPGRSPTEADQHWMMASNLLRGYAFTSTYRSSPDRRSTFCVSFQRMILADAVIRK